MKHLPWLAGVFTLLLGGMGSCPVWALPPLPGGPTADRKAGPDALAAADGNTQFALDLYARLSSTEGNLFFSPYSISTALAQVYSGARGETAEQFVRVLHFSLPSQRLHPAFAELLSHCKSDRPDCALHTANALWTQVDYPLVPAFVANLKRYYGVGVGKVDFVHEREKARRMINTWVEQQTRGTIKELLSPDHLSPLTRLVLANAVYFKGAWESPFQKDSTKEEAFHLSPTETARMPLMWKQDSFGYTADNTLQALELPYAGGKLSMVVLLPTKVDGLAALEKSLSKERLKNWLASMSKQKVEVYLPRFRMTRTLSLGDTLAGMGMPDAFDQDRADFRGISNSGPPLHISLVLHRAFVEVQEAGTEASAATLVEMSMAMAPPPGIEVRPPVFRADHPFLFLIRENRTGSILFMGRVTDPRS
jgi:serpin B